MGVTNEETVAIGQVRTTNAVATDVPGLSFTAADKTSELFLIEAQNVQENAPNPLGWWQLRHVVVAWSGGVPAFVDTSDGANGIVKRIGDAAILCTMVRTGGTNPVKVQVTGVAGTNLNWWVRVTRRPLFSVIP